MKFLKEEMYYTSEIEVIMSGLTALNESEFELDAEEELIMVDLTESFMMVDETFKKTNK